MYTVEWCDCEGILRQRPFENLEDARLEVADLEEKYGSAWVSDENGNVIEA